MELTEEQHEKITAIMESMECSKDFKCYKSGFESICKAKDKGSGEYANCLGKAHEFCEFRLSFGSVLLCKCPLRVYVAKNLK